MRTRGLQTQTFLVACLLLAASVAVVAGRTQGGTSKEEAIRTASQLTGFDTIEGVTTSAYDEMVLEDDVPFLEIAGRRVWRVQFDNVRITWEWEGKVQENAYVHRFDVLVAASDGTPLKVISPLPPGRGPETTLAERGQFLHSMGVRYEGLPRDHPVPNLLQALRAIGPRAAKQIEALYVLYRQVLDATVMEEAARGEVRLQPWQERAVPFWIITSRYLPPTPLPVPAGVPSPPPPPPGAYEHWMRKIDATTGRPVSDAVARVGWRPLNGPGPCSTVATSLWESYPRPMVLLNPGYGSLPLAGARHENGSALVALAAFCDEVGAALAADEATQSATATLAERSVTFTLGRAVAVAKGPNHEILRFAQNDGRGASEGMASPTTNNQQLTTQEMPLRVAPYLNEEGRMMVPLRPLVEALGGTVKWEPEAQIVYVNLPAAVSSQPPGGEPAATDGAAAG